MCTILLAYRAVADWPIIVGNNRDEFFSRTAIPPRVFANGRLQRWIAPVDESSGGSWWACNNNGLLVFLTNRWNGLPPDESKISRGKLVQSMIQNDSIAAAGEWLCNTDLSSYNPFNLLVMTTAGGFLASNYPAFEKIVLSPGLYCIANGPLVDDPTLKIKMARRRFASWSEGGLKSSSIFAGFRKLLRISLPQEFIPPQGFNVKLDEYGTTSSTIVAFSGHRQSGWCCYYASGNPLSTPYTDYSSMTLLC